MILMKEKRERSARFEFSLDILPVLFSLEKSLSFLNFQTSRKASPMFLLADPPYLST